MFSAAAFGAFDGITVVYARIHLKHWRASLEQFLSNASRSGADNGSAVNDTRASISILLRLKT